MLIALYVRIVYGSCENVKKEDLERTKNKKKRKNNKNERMRGDGRF